MTEEFHTFQVWLNGSMLSTATNADEKTAFCEALEKAVPFLAEGDEVLIRDLNEERKHARSRVTTEP